ncbi:transketolase [Aquella oligotrophica]|uniref:Transketolase n=1 Tax=Aquella oligotrophica TaxID=2067065 RepID=A0A2I7N5M6_9NEIS|nr:transketolase [Aquella oligotrophica]AUR51525.1 transketolase [Aquella oligotrophica]
MADNKLLANAIRMLAAEGVEKAKSGHPGAPMGMAELGVALWREEMRHNPINPTWFNRDRFVLSNGHASMFQYALLHLTGYNLSIEELKNFRQLHAKTPGHPEYGYAPGIETTTGPLGQGIANAVGMALAEKLLAEEFNRDGYDIVDHHTYAIVGDGCLMEGISHEVCSLAGTLGLGKLIVFYDDNNISIDGEVHDWYSENVAKRFDAYNWHVVEAIDGHDVDAIRNAIHQAKSIHNRPSLIICKTTIGKGSPNKAGKEESHGAPLGASEIELVKKELGWTYASFEIPPEVYAGFDCKSKGMNAENSWNQLFTEYQSRHPQLAAEFVRRMEHKLPDDWSSIVKVAVKAANDKQETIASRKASQNAIEFYAEHLPEFFGGSADLTGSNLTRWSKATTLTEANRYSGNYISYGVREFGMAAIMNGIFLHGGYRVFGGTFLMFSEYARNALRMASLMKIAPIFVFTHDSIGLGEDGPTHQPVEQIATLRMIPNMIVWRPCDTVETMVAWADAIGRNKSPSSLIFSRQNLKFIERSQAQIDNIARGGYILVDGGKNPDYAIIATGSEVELALNVATKLTSDGLKVRVISMPSTSVFDLQDESYRDEVLGGAKKMIAIEAGVSDSWYKYVGKDGVIIGIDTFGESAPAAKLFDHFGFSVDKIIARLK